MDNKKKLIYLLQEHCDFVNANEISKELNVSDRMIRHYVAQINGDSEKYIASNKSGYRLIKYPVHIFLNSYKNNMVRMFYIITALTDNDTGIDIMTLSEELNVSDSTIEQDIIKIQKCIQEYRLKFIRENYTIWIEGSEIDKRKLYKQLLLLDKDFYSFSSNIYRQLFSYSNLDDIRRVIEKRLAYYNLYITEYSLINLATQIGISVERIILGNMICEGELEDYHQIQCEDQMRLFSRDVIIDIEKLYRINLNNSEALELQSAIISRILPVSDNNIEKLLSDKLISKSTLTFVEHLINKITVLYHIDFNEKSFLLQFVFHIEQLIRRGKEEKILINPMKDVIKKDFPILFDIAVFISDEIRNEYKINVNEDEATFIVLHLGNSIQRTTNMEAEYSFKVGLIYPSYYNNGEKLVHYFETNSKENLTIDLFNHYEVESTQKYDFLISVLPINNKSNIPLLIVHPIPFEEDIRKIDILCEKCKNRVIDRLISELMKSFEVQIIEQDVYLNNNLSMIEYMGEILVGRSVVSEKFIQNVIAREEVSSTSFIKDIAFPHSSGIRANWNFIYIIKNKKAINWDKSKVKTVIFFGTTEKRTFLKAYETLLEVFRLEGNDSEHFIELLMHELR